MSGTNFKNRGEQVFETLKREILDLKLEPGRMVSENEICERFGVSRTPVRDALRLLQEQGFVEADDLYACSSGDHGAEGFSECTESYGHGRNTSCHCHAESTDPDTGL